MIIKIETESHHLFEYDIDWQSGEGELIDNRKMGGANMSTIVMFQLFAPNVTK